MRHVRQQNGNVERQRVSGPRVGIIVILGIET